MAKSCWAAAGSSLVIRAMAAGSSARGARLLAGAILAVTLSAGSISCGPGGKGAYCPVCSMKVDPNGPWTAEIVYSDGTKLLFESPGDMMTFYYEPQKYKVSDTQKDPARVEKMLVRDYNSKMRIEAAEAAFVYKSRIKGPMGPDLVPFSRSEDAASFAEANGGSVTGFGELTVEMIRALRK